MPTARPAAATQPAVLSLIGNTPLIRVTKFDTGPCALFLKLENQNPGGSIKDRIALGMITAAERDGRLKPGGTVVEATAGNTGLGLALVCAAKGYPLVLVIPDKMAVEKVNHLRALGADVRITRSDVGKGHPDYYQDIAERLALEVPGAVYMNQFANPANPQAHEDWTGPELLRQTGGDLDAVVVGVGSGGTLTGLGRCFAKHSPRTRLIVADPAGSIIRDMVQTGRHGEPGSWLVEGIGEDFVPPNCDLRYAHEAYTVTDVESLTTARELLRREGVLAGSSSGTLLAAALRFCRAQSEPKTVVSLVCDTGNKYLSKMFNDAWMADQGFFERRGHGDVRDLLTRRYDRGQVVTVAPDDTLLTAFKRMRIADVSQLPVMQGDHVIGLLDESDLLLHVEPDPARFRDVVTTAMTSRLETVPMTAPVACLHDIFDRNLVALVVDGPHFLGLLTRVDLLNHLRRRLR
jgi:cystathionine beta-synthase